MPAPAKPLSPAELASLEHAFATDPSSQAYRPLAEAYLGMNRFMEAMVVCKKGVKTHPDDPAPRLLLARVYAAQGKERKALEELDEALKRSPRHAAAERLAGVLHLKLGDKDAGVAALRRSYQTAPDDPETLEILRRWGIEREVAPPPPAPVASSPVASLPPSAASPPTAAGTPPPAAAAAPVPPSGATSPAPAAAAAAPAAAVATSAAPEPTPTPAPIPVGSARSAAYAAELAEKYATKEYTLEHAVPGARGKRSRGRLVATAGLGAALLVVLGVWFGVSSHRKARALEIDRLLRETREAIEKDGYASYRDAAKLCERILQRDPDSLGGHAYLAYVDAVRWGEHGEGEGVREEARKHLAAATRGGRAHSHAYAADAYLRFHGGDAKGALDGLRAVMTGPEGASPLLNGVLGVLLLESGDLDGARDALAVARQTAPSDVRIAQMLAEQWRRRGQGFEPQAAALYDAVLTRLAPDHVPSLLGKAQLLIDGGRADEATKRIARVLELGPAASPRQVAVAQALRGSALHLQGKGPEGDAAEAQALALDPSNPDVHDLVGRRKLRAGDAGGAAEEFQRAIQLEPVRLGFYVDLASALMQRPGGARQAVAALERAADRVGNARVTKLLGDAYRADGDLDRARTAYEKALGMEKRYPDARVALARTLRDRKDYPRAIEELERAVKEYAESPAGAGAPTAAAWVAIADAEEARGSRPDAVERAYTSALKADPASCPALFWLGRSRADRRGGRYDRALAAQMLGDYLKHCPRGGGAADAQRMLHALR